MAGITELATIFNLPNYVGELFAASPEDTPLLSAIGGLTGGQSAGATLFEWQGYDLRDADDGRQRLEGADADNVEARVRYSAHNVLEIHQEAVKISYTKQGATRQRTTGSMPSVTVGSTVIPADELAWQIEQQLKQIARDVEKTFLTGTFQNPTDNSQPRKTRGLRAPSASGDGPTCQRSRFGNLRPDAGRVAPRAPVAQWIERLPPEQKVAGSNPVRGTTE